MLEEIRNKKIYVILIVLLQYDFQAKHNCMKALIEIFQYWHYQGVLLKMTSKKFRKY